MHLPYSNKHKLMLRYLNRGLRTDKVALWDGKPPQVCRGNWEIMVIIRGLAQPVLNGEERPTWHQRQMWIVGPQSLHMWKRDPSQPCEVICAHFACLHPVMENFISPTYSTSVPLMPADITKIKALYARMLPHYRNPSLTSTLIFEQAMLEFCLLALQNIKQPMHVPGFDSNSTKVQQALVWYQDHLSEGIDASDVAAALSVSPSHLRRLFQAVMQDTPKQIFQRTALERACRYMVETGLSLKEIAYLCGYKGFSQFHRAFRAQYQQSPEEWRRNTYYKPLGIRPEASPLPTRLQN
jgi:AraC-like DNA-binding protein